MRALEAKEIADAANKQQKELATDAYITSFYDQISVMAHAGEYEYTAPYDNTVDIEYLVRTLQSIGFRVIVSATDLFVDWSHPQVSEPSSATVPKQPPA